MARGLKKASGLLGTFAAVDVVKTAADFESSLAGLAKATDLDPSGLAALREELFATSTTLAGVEVGNLLEIATSGAKLGVPADQVTAYAEAVAKVSTAIDDLPAAEIADSIGKINSVFKLDTTQGALQLGSAIDRIADSGVSSASGVLDFVQRISGSAKAAKISAQESVALAGALLDTGSTAELGATSVTKLIAAFASSADPLESMIGYLDKLRNQDAATQLTSLSDIGIEGVQARAEIQKLAQQTDTLRRYIGLANEEFTTLNQIEKSYAATAQTTNALFTQTGNQVEILKESLGRALLPSVNAGLAALNGLASGAKRVFEETFLPGVHAIRDRLAEFPGWVNEAFGEGSTGSIVGFATLIKDNVLWAIEGIGFAWRNLPDLVDVAVLQISERFINVGEVLAAVWANLKLGADYIVNNWTKLHLDAINAVATAFTNLGTNLGNLAYAVAEFFEDPTQGFQFNWTPLLDGFKATAAELPELIKPELTSLQSEIDAALAKIGEKEAARAAAVAKGAAKVPPGAAAKAIPPPGSELDEDDGPKAKEKLSAAALELGSAEARSAVLAHRTGSSGDPIRDVAKTGKDQLSVARQTLTEMRKLAANSRPLEVATF